MLHSPRKTVGGLSTGLRFLSFLVLFNMSIADSFAQEQKVDDKTRIEKKYLDKNHDFSGYIHDLKVKFPDHDFRFNHRRRKLRVIGDKTTELLQFLSFSPYVDFSLKFRDKTHPSLEKEKFHGMVIENSKIVHPRHAGAWENVGYLGGYPHVFGENPSIDNKIDYFRDVFPDVEFSFIVGVSPDGKKVVSDVVCYGCRKEPGFWEEPFNLSGELFPSARRSFPKEKKEDELTVY